MQLAPYAAQLSSSRGRRFAEEAPTYRSDYQRDRDRIVHSSAFRRLEYKTQVFVNHEGDMFRTRLTHSIEVAQLSRSIARILELNEDLSETIALAHDLGHTPFGHAGQDALNASMKDYGGFEHNLQSLRTVDKLEQSYAEFPGLNLTFESREGILKHCSLKNAKQLGDVGERFLKKQQPSLEAQTVNLADEVAYNNHDVDDGLRSGLINMEQLLDIRLFREQFDLVQKQFPDIQDRRQVHEIIRRMINRQVIDLIDTTRHNLQQIKPGTIDDIRNHSHELAGFSPDMLEMNQELKRFLRKQMYSHFRVHRMSVKATHIIQHLFNAFFDDPKLLSPKYHTIVKQKQAEHGDAGKARAIADYIAGMTDRYAIAEYGKIFNPGELT